MTKVYDLTPTEYKVISGITANTCANDNTLNKKDTYKTIKQEFLDSKKNDPNAITVFETWLADLNAKSGYVKAAKKVKAQRATKAVKLENLNSDFLKGVRTLPTNAKAIAPKKAAKVPNIVAKPSQVNEAKHKALVDLYKEGLLTKAEIAHEYKQGNITLTTFLEIVG